MCESTCVGVSCERAKMRACERECERLQAGACVRGCERVSECAEASAQHERAWCGVSCGVSCARAAARAAALRLTGIRKLSLFSGCGDKWDGDW